MARPRPVTVTERRARLGRRHHLARTAGATDPVEVARGLVGIHSTDPRTVFLSLWSRMPSVDVGTIERALYEERSLVRMLGMRRTLFVVPRELAPVLQAACAVQIEKRERRRLLQWLGEANLAKDPATWLRLTEQLALDAVRERGEAVATEVAGADPNLAARFVLGAGSRFETEVSIASRTLLLLAMEGKIARGRPRGTWISSQYRWSPIERWFADGMPEMTAEDAQAELVRRWLASYGPGTEADLRWWTGLTAREIRRALLAAKAVEVDLDGATGWTAEGDERPVRPPKPWVALLPSLDSTVMGWAGREWYLGEHGPLLFDRSGNAGPTVWWDGRVVGAWSQHADGTIVFGLLEDVGAEAKKAIRAEAERLQEWLGDVRVIPRFPTPVERELRSG